MPSNAGSGRVFDQQRMFECQRTNTREFCGPLAKGQQEVGQVFSLLQSAAIES
jgi:hypothetical protein